MFDLDPATLFLSIVLSSVGIGYYSYGKKHGGYYQITGAILLAVTFFINSFWLLMGIGAICILFPIFIERS
jgi:hypothetical protein